MDRNTEYYFEYDGGVEIVQAFSLNEATKIFLATHDGFTNRYIKAQYERVTENEE